MLSKRGGAKGCPPKRIAPNQSAAFMRLKLDHSQKVLEGLTLEDFELMAKHAQQIALLTEDETWLVDTDAQMAA